LRRKIRQREREREFGKELVKAKECRVEERADSSNDVIRNWVINLSMLWIVMEDGIMVDVGGSQHFNMTTSATMDQFPSTRGHGDHTAEIATVVSSSSELVFALLSKSQ